MTKVADRVKQLDFSGIRSMFAASSKDFIDLSLGRPDFDVPQAVKRACISAILNSKNSYTPTEGILELRQAIARKLRRENKIRAEPDNIIVTCGALGALSIIFQTLFERGDEVIVPDPFFVAYPALIKLNGATPVFVDTYPDFALIAEQLRLAITPQTKAIILNNPCNPTGHVFSKAELKAVARIAREHNLLVISDEVYEKFVYDGKHHSIADIYPNTVTINGFSKSHAMAGWRIGYVHGPEEIIHQALKAQQFNFTCAPAPFQHAAIAALKTPMHAQIRAYKKKRDFIWQSLKDLYVFQKPKGAFYAFIASPMHLDHFVQVCLRNHLVIVPGTAFSRRTTHFRLCFAASQENLAKAADILNGVGHA